MTDQNRISTEQAIFQEAILIADVRKRDDYLSAVCRDNVALRRRVDALLQSDEDGGSFMRKLAAPSIAGANEGEGGSPNSRFHSSENAAIDTPIMSLAGQTLGKYQVDALIGSGGMGEVYRARDVRLGRAVAVKVLPERLAGDPSRQARFEREMRAVAALSHPNILAIHDCGTQGTVSYAVMELLEGETLRSRLAKGPIAVREVLEIGAAIAEGLAAAHAKGIIHRDLKPENLFLTADGRVKILDFGLARLDPRCDSPTETATFVTGDTHAGTVIGTVGYMSPEQVRGQPADARSDIFSLGCVLYEMVTGVRAFRRDSAAETMAAILQEDLSDLTLPGSPVPAELAGVIRHCLAKNPNQRLQSAHDLALGLRATGSDPRISGLPKRRSSWLTAAVPGALVVVGFIVAAAYLATRDQQQPSAEGAADMAERIDAVAVLPFVYMGSDPKTQLLSETLAGHIIDSLGQVRRGDLKIRPPSSVSRYSRNRLDLDYPTIGRTLNVPVIVTGTMEENGMDLRIRVEVVEAREHDVRWSQIYHGRVGERLNLDVQDRIVQDVAVQLGLRLNDEERRRLTLRRTPDAEAYDLYRQAMIHLNRFTRQGLADAIDLCNRAIARDQEFALAHATLARCHILRGTLYDGVKTTFDEAQASVDQALRLDKNLALAHGAQGAIYLFEKWNWPAAEREFKLAIKLDPHVPITHNLYGFYLIAHGELAKALESIKKGQELDPDSAARRNELAICYNAMGRYREAIAEVQEALKIDENFPLAYVQLGDAYLGEGLPEKAIEELTAAISRGHQNPSVKGMLGCAYAAAGQPMEAEAVLKELERLAAPGRYFSFAMPIARIYAALGEKDSAFDWLKKAIEERDSSLFMLRFDPTLENLRGDERFTDLLQEMRLPP